MTDEGSYSGRTEAKNVAAANSHLNKRVTDADIDARAAASKHSHIIETTQCQSFAVHLHNSRFRVDVYRVAWKYAEE
jgi:hypothetical protein